MVSDVFLQRIQILKKNIYIYFVVTRFLSTQFLGIVYKSAVVYFMLFAINTGLFFNMQICHLSRS